MLSFHVKFVQTDRRLDRRTTVKHYAPDLSIRGHKNKKAIEPCSLKRGLLYLQHGINPGQSELYVQADLGGNILQMVNFLYAKGKVLPHDSVNP